MGACLWTSLQAAVVGKAASDGGTVARTAKRKQARIERGAKAAKRQREEADSSGVDSDSEDLAGPGPVTRTPSERHGEAWLRMPLTADEERAQLQRRMTARTQSKQVWRALMLAGSGMAPGISKAPGISSAWTVSLVVAYCILGRMKRSWASVKGTFCTGSQEPLKSKER